MRITSPTNPTVKRLRALRDRATRRAEAATLVEGIDEVRRAVGGGASIREAFVATSALDWTEGEVGRRLAAGGVPIVEVADGPFSRIAVRGPSAGVVAVAADPTVALEGLAVDGGPLILVVEGIEKPGNLGGMLRTADAVGVDAVIVADPTTDVTNPNVVRASLGCLFTIPVAVATADATRAFLRSSGIAVVAAAVSATAPPWEADLTGAVAIVVGAEHEGLSPVWSDAERPVHLPMVGAADSLNAGVAAAVVMYEAVRQRR